MTRTTGVKRNQAEELFPDLLHSARKAHEELKRLNQKMQSSGAVDFAKEMHTGKTLDDSPEATTYEELYPADYTPGEFSGPLADDPRSITHQVTFSISFHCREDPQGTGIHDRGGWITGPTHMIWDVLEFKPDLAQYRRPGVIAGNAAIMLYEHLVRNVSRERSSMPIYRWHEKRECWRRIASGPLNGLGGTA